MDRDLAIEIFVSGILGIPSVENRSERRMIGDIPVLHFNDAWNTRRRVAAEFIVQTHEPPAVLAAVAACPAPQHLITLIDRPATEHQAYGAAGYQRTATESLMVRSLATLPPRDARYVVERIHAPDQLDWVNTHDPAGSAWITATRLNEPRFRHFFIALDQRPVARARVVRYDPLHAYVAHVYTAAGYRRRGLAQAIMADVLHDAAGCGEQWSVLVSSEAGLRLYQALGYETLASVVVFKPATSTRAPV